MFKKFSGFIVNLAAAKNVIKPNQVDECIYGINTLLTSSLNMLTALIIGLIFNKFFEMVLFIVVYKTVRKYSGGRHSATALGCYIVSVITYIIAVLCIEFCSLPSSVLIIISFAASVVLAFISPIEAEKKPLNSVEKRVYKFKCIITLIVWLLVLLVLWYIKSFGYFYYNFIKAIVTGLVTVTLFAVSSFCTQRIKMRSSIGE